MVRFGSVRFDLVRFGSIHTDDSLLFTVYIFIYCFPDSLFSIMAWNEFSAANEKEVYRLLTPLIKFAEKPTTSEHTLSRVDGQQQQQQPKPPPTKRKAKTPAANKPKQRRQLPNPNKKQKTKQTEKSDTAESELVTVENFI